MSYQDQINDQAQRLQTAYTAYRAVYTTMTPPPQPLPVPDKPDYQADNVFIRGILAVILTGSMIVSGSHTIPTFAGGTEFLHLVVGVAAFCMLEAAIVAFAYIRTQRHFQTSRTEPENLKDYVNGGLFIAFLVAVLGNIDYTLRSKGFYIAELFQVGILLGMAVSAPVLAFITGDVLAMYQVQDRGKQRRHVEAYEQKVREADEMNRAAQREWEEGLAKAWDANKARWGGTTNVRVERPSDPALDGRNFAALPRKLSTSVHLSNGQDTDGQVDSPYGHSFERKANASELVAAWLTQHPEDITANVRDLAARLNVGKSTVSKIQSQFKAQGG